jgi:hypothetical protein
MCENTKTGETMANGSVYVFNVSSETMNPFNTNGMSAGEINGWDRNYTPQQLRVPRVLNRNESPGKFVNGTNMVILAWASGNGDCSIPINDIPLNQDLMLYVSKNRWVLYNQFGAVQTEGPINS